MKISVVCPTFNEAENIPVLVKALGEALAAHDYEIIISDDDSPDGTWERAETLARDNTRLRVLHRMARRGLGWSVIDGFTIASGDLLACMDADMQHDPRILPLLIDEIVKGSDIALGSRYVKGGSPGEWRLHRRAQSWLATKLAQRLLRIKITDPMAGYFVLRRTDFLRVRDYLNGCGFKILLELMAHIEPTKVAEIPYTFRPRHAGHSKLSSSIVSSYFVQLWRLRRLQHARKVAAKALEPHYSGLRQPEPVRKRNEG